MQMNTVKVESHFGATIHNLFLTHETASDKLMVMLPGRGYTCEHPLMYYLRRAAMTQGYDVLSVQYGFQVANTELTGENAVYLRDDVQKAVDGTLPGGYRQVCVVGKSMGTPLATELARSLTNDVISLIQLTPIGGAVQELENIRTLAIIGTADPLYNAEEVATFKDHSTITWKVLDGLNHSLENPDDWRVSLAMLLDITATCEAFIG